MTTTLAEGSRRKFFTYSFYALAFGLPVLVPQWHSILLFIFVVAWAVNLRPKEAVKSLKSDKLLLGVFAGVFSINLIGLLYSENLAYGLTFVERLIPFIVFPTILLTLQDRIPGAVLRNVIIAFLAGVLTLNLASLAFISYDLWDFKRLESNLIVANNAIVDIHPIFLSLYISFCLFFIAYFYLPFPKGNRHELGWILFSLVILLVYLIWLNSRVGILSFVVASAFYLVYALKKTGRIVSLLVLGVFIVLLLTTPFSRRRFLEGPLKAAQQNTRFDQKDHLTRNFFYRKDINRCSMELVKGPEILYGYGTGDFIDILHQCYSTRDYTWLIEDDLDSQCEYFAEMHRQGIVGLLLFLAVIIVPMYYAIRYQNPLYAVFMILFGITALFENVLSSQKGVTFFALFCPLLYLLAKQTHKHPSAPAGLK